MHGLMGLPLTEPHMSNARTEHIAQLAELIRDVEVAMFTTTGVDGRLYSRPLATQQVYPWLTSQANPIHYV